jgi:glycerol-3-phosphate dehydrogenase
MYDILAGKENMEGAYLMSARSAMEAFPMIKSDGLVGGVVYHDGMSQNPCLPVLVMDCRNLD